MKLIEKYRIDFFKPSHIAEIEIDKYPDNDELLTIINTPNEKYDGLSIIGMINKYYQHQSDCPTKITISKRYEVVE